LLMGIYHIPNLEINNTDEFNNIENRIGSTLSMSQLRHEA